MFQLCKFIPPFSNGKKILENKQQLEILNIFVTEQSYHVLELPTAC